MNILESKIKELKALGWLTSQLAFRVGVSPSTMARWADGYYSELGMSRVSRIPLDEVPPINTRGRPLGSKTTAKKAKKKGTRK